MPVRLRVLVLTAIAVSLALSAAASLTRTQRFTPDSRNYVDVAENLLQGRGLVQDTVGFGEGRFLAHDRACQPFGVHGPLYPLLIAGLGALGVPLTTAALAIPLAAHAGILWAGFRLMLRLYDLPAALWTLLLLLASYPLSFIADTAWAEGLGVLLWLASLLVLMRRPPEQAGAGRILLAGIVGALAFAARYPLVLALPVGGLLLVGRDGTPRALRRIALYAAGFAAVALPLVARNVLVTGHVTGAVRNPPVESPRSNLFAAVEVLVGHPFARPVSSRDPLPPAVPERELQAALLGLGVLPVLLRARGEGAGLLRERFLAQRRFMIPVGLAAYTAFVVGVRSLMHFDPLDARLLSPAHVLMMGLWGAALGAGLRLPPAAIAAAIALLAGVKASQAGRLLATTPAADLASQVRESPRLRWIEACTRREDLVIGDDSEDVAFALGRSSLYFTAHPHMRPLTAADLAALLREACPRHPGVYLVLRARPSEEPRGLERWGAFVAELAAGRADALPQLGEPLRLPDALVYRARCSPAAGVEPPAPACRVPGGSTRNSSRIPSLASSTGRMPSRVSP